MDKEYYEREVAKLFARVDFKYSEDVGNVATSAQVCHSNNSVTCLYIIANLLKLATSLY